MHVPCQTRMPPPAGSDHSSALPRSAFSTPAAPFLHPTTHTSPPPAGSSGSAAPYTQEHPAHQPPLPHSAHNPQPPHPTQPTPRPHLRAVVAPERLHLPQGALHGTALGGIGLRDVVRVGSGAGGAGGSCSSRGEAQGFRCTGSAKEGALSRWESEPGPAELAAVAAAEARNRG